MMYRSSTLSIALFSASIVTAIGAPPIQFPSSELYTENAASGLSWEIERVNSSHDPLSPQFNSQFVSSSVGMEDVREVGDIIDGFSFAVDSHANIATVLDVPIPFGEGSISVYDVPSLADTAAYVDIWSGYRGGSEFPSYGDQFKATSIGSINEQITFNSQALTGTTGKLILNLSVTAKVIHELEPLERSSDSLETSLRAGIHLGDESANILEVGQISSHESGYEVYHEVTDGVFPLPINYDNHDEYLYFMDGTYEFSFVFGEEVAFQLVSEALVEMGYETHAMGSAGISNFALNWYEVVDENGLYVDDLVIEGSQIFVTPIPEPSTYLMLGTGLGLAYFFFRRRNKHAV